MLTNDDDLAKKLQEEFDAEDKKMKKHRLQQEKDASYKKTVTGMGMSVFEMKKTQFNQATGLKTRKQKEAEDSSSDEESLADRAKRSKK